MSLKEEKNGLRTWIEIDKKAVEHNYETIRRLLSSKCKLMSVVKSNAYGHGLLEFSHEIENLGADWLGVDSVWEALALRKDGIKKPILVLGFTLSEKIEEAIENDISITVSSFETLEAIKVLEVSKKAKIHIKVDTGMGRQGFLPQDLEKVLEFLLKIKDQGLKIETEGLYTHFASAKNPAFPKYTMTQVGIFNKWVEAFNDAGFDPIKHAAASSGTLIFPETHFDMVRVGIAMYGLWPSPEVEAFCREKIILKPVLSWKTVIGEVKELPKGSKVGYDSTETLEKDSRIAICPIGYWHGFPRALSSIGRVLVNGKRCRVIGRVSMDMITIDVSKVGEVKVGDEVVIIGKQAHQNFTSQNLGGQDGARQNFDSQNLGGQEEIKADELANLSDTTNYEIITRINPLIKRVFLD